jgi:hypothetical protein
LLSDTKVRLGSLLGALHDIRFKWLLGSRFTREIYRIWTWVSLPKML